MSIDLGNHIDLSMTGISLRSFQITVVQFKLVYYESQIKNSDS